jgi:uncharacterized membrane protein
VPVYVLARRELENPGAALGFAALYLLYPAVGYLNLLEFHPEALSTPALLAAFAMMRSGRVAATAAWAALALLGKEDVALAVGRWGSTRWARGACPRASAWRRGCWASRPRRSRSRSWW